MIWYFEDPRHVALLQREAAEWEGTPFREQSKVKGPYGGTDCAGFDEALMVAAGAVTQLNLPRR